MEVPVNTVELTMELTVELPIKNKELLTIVFPTIIVEVLTKTLEPIEIFDEKTGFVTLA